MYYIIIWEVCREHLGKKQFEKIGNQMDKGQGA